jgi:hypothetical protein
MKLSRMLLALALVATLSGVAYVSQRSDPPATRMAAAAQKFIDSLTPDQKKVALFDFDDKERTNWHFIPLQDNKTKLPTRKGLRLQEMNTKQKELALALVAAGTSETGNKQATTIMSLESILKELEKGGANVRDPEWYFFTIFGTPGKAGKWGWRVEGHHLSINYTLENNDVIAATPTFFGANPADPNRVKGRKGDRILPEAEDYARELFKSLDDNQKTEASQKKQHGEPKAQSVTADVGPPAGIVATKLSDKQRDLLMKLVRSYADRLPPEVAGQEMKAAEAGGVDKIHFAYFGSTEPGKGYTYRIQGPTFVIEFLNVQADSANNPANHIHSCWRRIDGDFGIKKK